MIYNSDKTEMKKAMHEIMKEAVNELERRVDEAFPKEGEEINRMGSIEKAVELFKEIKKEVYNPQEEFAKKYIDINPYKEKVDELMFNKIKGKMK